MFGFQNISVELLGSHIWISLLAAVLLILIAVRLYWNTNPPLSVYMRVFLFSLRTIAILSLVAALLQPIIRFEEESVRKPNVSILVDESGSMDRVESGKSRLERLDSLMESPSMDLLRDGAATQVYYFGDSAKRSRTEVSSERTALGEVLSQVDQIEISEPADFWLLFSDGRSNSGRAVSEVAPLISRPINCVDISSSGGIQDISIKEIDFNPVLYSGRAARILVKLRWRNRPDRLVPVRLYDGKRLIVEESFRISQEDGEGEIDLKFIPASPGKKLLQIQIPIEEGESNSNNNQKTIDLDVLKGRLKVMLWTSHPNYETGFLNRFLINSERIDVDLVVSGDKGGNLSRPFPTSQTELNRYDLLIFHDPEPVRLERHKNILETYLTDRGGGIALLLGERFAKQGSVSWFNGLLPFYQSQPRNAEQLSFQGEPSESQLFHPVVKLGDDRESIRKAWAALPPFETLVRCDIINPGSVILAYAGGPISSQVKVPIIGVRKHGAGKLVAISALPLWQWKFLGLGYSGESERYDQLLQGIIDWLTVPEDSEPVRIISDGSVFPRGELVRFSGVAYDQGFRPLEGINGGISLKSESNGQSYEADLLKRSEGKYRAEFGQLPPGDYQYKGWFDRGSERIKEVDGRIHVESYSLEEIDQSGDVGTLREIARQTGGKQVAFKEFDQLVAGMDFSEIIDTRDKELTLWGEYWLLALFIAVLAVDWGIRKFNHLL